MGAGAAKSFVSRDCVRAELPGGPADSITAHSYATARDYFLAKQEAPPALRRLEA